MNLAPMSFGSYVWPCNPEHVKVERARNTVQFRVPGGACVVQADGSAPRRITGSGRLTGSGCLTEFGRLSQALTSGGSGTLCLPGMQPFQAVCVSLSMKGAPGPNCVEYEFEFLEDASPTEVAAASAEVYLCEGGETLWEVANRFGADVDALRLANPQIEWLNALKAGEKVKIV
jgi:hypothetical protein